ncbi:MAG TPA: tetratricopeptide repeat protein [Thermoanaerobaculia bacterium]|nr:tetratricopeptide repeat protein [Thermoanaerobaculia bacterium]
MFQRFPRSDETWQIGRFRLPVWVENEAGTPFRPWVTVCLRLPSGLIFSLAAEETESFGFWKTLLGAVEEWGLVPGRVQVSEADLVEELRERLAVHEIPVELREGLPELEEAFGELGRELSDAVPGALAGEGVTVEQMTSFAEAAALFMVAEPWRHLADDDPIHVEAPDVLPEARYVSVMGRGGQSYGLLFHREQDLFQERDEERLRETVRQDGLWAVSFDEAPRLPPEDLDLWERHRLPLAHERAYPLASHLGPDRIRRPDARLLDLFEGVLRALASTTEDEMDSGRWKKKVVTHGGRATIVLSLPFLLDPPAPELTLVGQLQMERVLWEIDRRFGGREEPPSAEEIDEAARQVLEGGGARRLFASKEEKARELALEARGARGRRCVALARQALKLWPDCADAYVALADEEPDPDRERELYALGVAAGERALGPEYFREAAGRFWGFVRTRPYMRARHGLAEALWHGGVREQREEAVEHFQEMLRLNPNDNQGIRYRLVHALLVLRRHDELAHLLDSYSEDDSVDWAYTRVLLAFRRHGDSPGARTCLTLALRRNRHVPAFLPVWEEVPPVPDLFAEPGSELEAASYASRAGEVWKDTPGARGWLLARMPSRPRRKKKAKKKSRVRKGR